jgi:hypothetical protein
MARTTIKSTYSLDVETVRALESMARRWKVSKSEALRRAIRSAEARVDPARSGALAALDELQKSLDLTEDQASRWQRRVRRERRATSRRGESRAP